MGACGSSILPVEYTITLYYNKYIILSKTIHYKAETHPKQTEISNKKLQLCELSLVFSYQHWAIKHCFKQHKTIAMGVVQQHWLE